MEEKTVHIEENTALIKQIKAEFSISERYKKDKREKWKKQMRMMNNEKKVKDKV